MVGHFLLEQVGIAYALPQPTFELRTKERFILGSRGLSGIQRLGFFYQSECLTGGLCDKRLGSAIPLPIGPIVVPFWGSYLESYKVIPKRNYYGVYG